MTYHSTIGLAVALLVMAVLKPAQPSVQESGASAIMTPDRAVELALEYTGFNDTAHASIGAIDEPVLSPTLHDSLSPVQYSELGSFLSQSPGAGAILLLRNYESALSPASVLMRPVYWVLKSLGSDSGFASSIGHWVLLHRMGKEHAIIMDPFLGKVQLTRNRLEKRWDGHGMTANGQRRLVL